MGLLGDERAGPQDRSFIERVARDRRNGSAGVPSINVSLKLTYLSMSIRTLPIDSPIHRSVGTYFHIYMACSVAYMYVCNV